MPPSSNPAATGAASLVYSSYLGGATNESSWGIDMDPAGRIYAAGYVASTVAVDATSTGQAANAAAVTVSHTTSGSERLMLVGISVVDSSGPPAVTSVTYNGDALTFVGSRATTGGGNTARVDIWQLVAPDVGTHNLTVNFSSAPDGATVGVTTYTGVNQVTPLEAFGAANANGTTGSATIVSDVGQLVFAAIVVDATDQDLVPGAGQTERWDLFPAGAAANGGGSTEAGAASVAMSWSWSSSARWAIGGVSIRPHDDIFVEVIDPAGNGAADRLYLGLAGGGDDENAWAAAYANGKFYVAGNAASTSGVTPSGYDTELQRRCSTATWRRSASRCDGYDQRTGVRRKRGAGRPRCRRERHLFRWHYAQRRDRSHHGQLRERRRSFLRSPTPWGSWAHGCRRAGR